MQYTSSGSSKVGAPATREDYGRIIPLPVGYVAFAKMGNR